jgi:hypothetical protein
MRIIDYKVKVGPVGVSPHPKTQQGNVPLFLPVATDSHGLIIPVAFQCRLHLQRPLSNESPVFSGGLSPGHQATQQPMVSRPSTRPGLPYEICRRESPGELLPLPGSRWTYQVFDVPARVKNLELTIVKNELRQKEKWERC